MFYRFTLRSALWGLVILFAWSFVFLRQSPWITDPSQDFGLTYQRAATALSRWESLPGHPKGWAIASSPGGIELERVMIPEDAVTRILEKRLKGHAPGSAPTIARHLLALCRTHHYDPAFILAVIDVESRFQVRARSPVGALGLMQLMPATARVVAKKAGIPLRSGSELLSDPLLNLTLGVTYLRTLREKYQDDSPYFQFAAYNIGPHKLDQLRKRPGGFRPDKTLKYYRTIREKMAYFRALAAMKTEESELMAQRGVKKTVRARPSVNNRAQPSVNNRARPSVNRRAKSAVSVSKGRKNV